MNVTSIKTPIITQDTNLFHILDEAIVSFKEKSIIVVTSKIISITEGRVVPIERVSMVSKGENEQKDRLIEQESQYYLPRETNKYQVSLTITQNTLTATAGIDESNGNGHYILWPDNPQKSANHIRKYLREKFGIKNLGVIITDSKTTPLRWGVTGIAIAYSGFLPLKDYIGTPDIFGRLFVFEKMSIVDNLAAAAALVMGEGNEKTPLALIQDVPFVQFQEEDPTDEELKSLFITKEEDLYGPLLNSVDWEKGKK